MVWPRPRSPLLRNRHMVFQHGPQAPNPRGEGSRTPRLYCMKYQQRNQINLLRFFAVRCSAFYNKTINTLTNSYWVLKSSAQYKSVTTKVLS